VYDAVFGGRSTPDPGSGRNQRVTRPLVLRSPLLTSRDLVVEFPLVAGARWSTADGLWRSLVAHLTGGQGVASSNLASPTIFHLVGAISHGLYLVRWG
jgi:hypothetical protein